MAFHTKLLNTHENKTKTFSVYVYSYLSSKSHISGIRKHFSMLLSNLQKVLDLILYPLSIIFSIKKQAFILHISKHACAGNKKKAEE